MSQPIIRVEGLSKKFDIGKKRSGGYTALRDVLAQSAKNIFAAKQAAEEEFWALKDVSFDIQQGEAVGIIGRNGAGKSTLLKILSRITEPTKGRITLNGRVASLLEVGTGFHPELTGRENIFLNGAILGMSRAEIKAKFDEIVDFSGVEKFLDTPVKRYSSGMYVRLAFAVAAHLEPEILIVDEVLAVGDGEFQKKCLGKMDEVSKKEGRTVLFVSHDLNAIARLCGRTILLDRGKIKLIDNPNNAILQYHKLGKNSSSFRNTSKDILKKEYIDSIFMEDITGTPKNTFFVNEPICFRIRIVRDNLAEIDNRVRTLFVLISDKNKHPIFCCETQINRNEYLLKVSPFFLVRGEYLVDIHINIPGLEFIDSIYEVLDFTISDSGSALAKHGDWNYGHVFGQFEWN